MVDEKTRFSESDEFVNDVIPLNPLVQLTKLISVLLSYVITSSFILIKKFLNKEIKKVKVIELKQINLKNLIKLRVNRKQVGSDRLANAIGTMEKNKNYIVIDFGTATTFDVITNNNEMLDLIKQGQAVFGISLGPIHTETEAEIHSLYPDKISATNA